LVVQCVNKNLLFSGFAEEYRATIHAISKGEHVRGPVAQGRDMIAEPSEGCANYWPNAAR
jgi:hypothetical protein